MVSRPAVPSNARDVTVDWLRQALAFAGSFDPRELEAMQIEPVGSGRGLMSEVIRCRLSWSPGARQTPESVIVKLHSPEGKTSRLARALKFYRREYDFYRRIGPSAALRSPAMLYGDFAPRTHRFVLVLEDLEGLESIPQARGASRAQATSAVHAAARMHGRYWNNVNQPALAGVLDYLQKYRLLTQLAYLFYLSPALHRFGSLFTPEMRHLAETYGPRVVDHLTDLSAGPKTFTHGDFRLDNMLFGPDAAADFIVIDWQNCGIHSGLRDVAYFLSNSVTTELRRSIEREVIEEYHAALCHAGVAGFSLSECWSLYRSVTLSCLIAPVVMCGGLDFSNPRSRCTIEIGLSRTLAAVQDLDADEFLPGRRRIFSIGGMTSALSAGAYHVRSAFG